VNRRELRTAVVASVLALGVPVGAAAWLGHRTDQLADHLGAVAGIAATIGRVDADLSGTIRLTDVALGELCSAEAIEASVALESLLAGQLGADEIRVAGPRVSVEVDASGDSDLARVVRRLAGSSPDHVATIATARPTAVTPRRVPRVRRIVVSSGTLIARVSGLGELSADDVELLPDADGVRVITGKVRIRGGIARLHGELELARSAAEVTLPHVKFGRVLAVAGTGTVTAGTRTITLRDLAIGRLQPGGALEARAAIDEGGVARQIAVALSPPHGDEGFTLQLHGDRVPLAAFAAFAPHGVGLDGAHASGDLSVRRRSDGLQLSADGAIDGLRFDHHAIAPQPIAVAVAVRGKLVVSADAVALESVAIDLGAIHASASGWLRRGNPTSGQLDVRLASAPCDQLLASLPVEVRGPLDGMVATGTFGGRARLAVDLAAPPGDGVQLDTSLDNRCDVTAEPPAADVTGLAGVAEQVYGDGSRARVGRGVAGWVELRRLPSWLTGAFVSAEDGRFFDHPGFDVVQIARSLEIDLRDRRLARGGSTISQQLVKNAFLTQRRSVDRKIQEAILTWRLEARLDKKTILERYLNVIELGPHVFGVEAAARYWFDTGAREMTVREAAFLAALTSEPQSMSRRVRHAGGLDADSASRVDIILRAMRRDGVIDKAQLDAAREAGLPFAATALRRES
jgi:hypothetical protein